MKDESELEPKDGEERAATEEDLNEPSVPIEAPVSVPVAEGETVQPDLPDQVSGTDADDSSVTDAASSEKVPSEEEQVSSLTQTPAEELDVDPNIEQPSQNPTDIVESDPGAEDEE